MKQSMPWQWLHPFLEAENLDIRKSKIAEILKTYTHDLYNNNTLQ